MAIRRKHVVYNETSMSYMEVVELNSHLGYHWRIYSMVDVWHLLCPHYTLVTLFTMYPWSKKMPGFIDRI